MLGTVLATEIQQETMYLLYTDHRKVKNTTQSITGFWNKTVVKVSQPCVYTKTSELYP